jgi:hypothetical protein
MQTLGASTFESFNPAVPSDVALVNCRGIYVGGAGSVSVSPDATTAPTVFSAPVVGAVLWVGLNQGRIMATGTSATLLVQVI